MEPTAPPAGRPDLAAPPGWHTGAAGIAYPPEPWHLGAELLVSCYLVPARALPGELEASVPPGHRLLRVGGRVPVGLGVAHYRPGGVLQYEELLLAVPVHASGRVRFCIPRIWVDSPASLHGGRDLWAIPKAMASFERRTAGRRVRTTVAVEGREVAALDARVGPRLAPGARRVALPTAQHLEGRTVLSGNVVLARVRALRAEWALAPDGPLGFLAGRRPAAGAALTDAAVVFGMGVRRR